MMFSKWKAFPQKVKTAFSNGLVNPAVSFYLGLLYYSVLNINRGGKVVRHDSFPQRAYQTEG